MCHRDVQNPTPYFAYPGLMAMRLSHRGVPNFLQLAQSPQSSIPSYSKKLTQNLGKWSRASTVRVRHAGSFRSHPKKGANMTSGSGQVCVLRLLSFNFSRGVLLTGGLLWLSSPFRGVNVRGSAA